MRYLKVINKSQGNVIGDKIEIADTYWKRLRGLLGRTGLKEGEGMILFPCWCIHCIGMRFTIDVVFLDKNKRVIELKENMKPGTNAYKYNAVYVLELKEGVIKEKQIKIGDYLEW